MMENNIRKLRKESGLSVQELADKTGSSVSMLMKIETGDRVLSNDWIKRFSQVFNVPAQALSDDPDYVFKIDNLEKMTKPKDDEREQVGTVAQGTNENEILRIFKKLSVKGQVEVLTFAYKTEENEVSLQDRDVS